MAGTNTPYRGRFAPSPTGPLHLGSLIAALASYLDARHCGGAWLVRMEDLDPPREEPGAAERLLHSLEQHGLHWDEDVLFQSTRAEAYEAALQQLDSAGHLFLCDCSRADTGSGGSCRGQCREKCSEQTSSVTAPCALRVAVPPCCSITLQDQLQGRQHSDLGTLLPDFVVRRKDHLYAYQLAVVVDDGEQGITDIVRGSDLLDSTARQIYLQGLLGYSTPTYLHIPVIANAQGQKFSKQNHAPPLQDSQAGENLRLALQFLQQALPPRELHRVDEILEYATAQWRKQSLPVAMTLTPAEAGLPSSSGPYSPDLYPGDLYPPEPPA